MIDVGEVCWKNMIDSAVLSFDSDDENECEWKTKMSELILMSNEALRREESWLT
jgi:hypothetical protein